MFDPYWLLCHSSFGSLQATPCIPLEFGKMLLSSRPRGAHSSLPRPSAIKSKIESVSPKRTAIKREAGLNGREDAGSNWTKARYAAPIFFFLNSKENSRPVFTCSKEGASSWVPF